MNRLSGHILACEIAGSLALVDVAVGDEHFTAMLLGIDADDGRWQPGTAVMLTFKETEVALAKNLSGAISMRNRLKGVVTRIETGRLLSKVVFDMDGVAISSVITTRSLQALQLGQGDVVEGLVKSNEMSVVLESSA